MKSFLNTLPELIVALILSFAWAIQFGMTWKIYDRTSIADTDLVYSIPHNSKIVQYEDSILWLIPVTLDEQRQYAFDYTFMRVAENDTTYIIYKRLCYVGTGD